jgi:hypothetical protein
VEETAMTAHPHVPSPLVADFLARVHLGPRQAHKALALWPLLERTDAPPSRAPACVPLADALDAGTLRVDELASGASIPTVSVHNRGEAAVLVLFGEELRGAMQNRIANASFLVASESEVAIDVSCVEHGRWSRRSPVGFASGRTVVSHALRRKMAKHVSTSRERTGRFTADQGQVWDEVGARIAHARAVSRSDAYADYVATRESDLREMAAAFRPLARQVGFVASIGDEIAGLEAVGRPELFERLFPALVRAYLIDAIDVALVEERRVRGEPEARAPRFDGPEPFLAALARARAAAHPSLGLGDDLRLEGAGVSGCALAAGDVVHMTAFPSEIA